MYMDTSTRKHKNKRRHEHADTDFKEEGEWAGGWAGGQAGQAGRQVRQVKQAGQTTAGPTVTTPESGFQPEQCTPFFHSASEQGKPH